MMFCHRHWCFSSLSTSRKRNWLLCNISHNQLHHQMSSTYQCTWKSFLSSHDRQRTSFQGWKVANHRNRVKVEPKRRRELVRMSTIYSRGNYFPCDCRERLNKLFHCIKNKKFLNEITSNCYALPRQDSIIYWYDDQFDQAPCLVL